jgi:hypothetical protein
MSHYNSIRLINTQFILICNYIMDRSQIYKLKYQKYKNKYGNLKQHGGTRQKVGQNIVYTSQDGAVTCTVPSSPTHEKLTGSYGDVLVGDDGVGDPVVVKQFKKSRFVPERVVIDNCKKEYRILQMVVNVPGVINVLGEHCDDRHSIIMLQYGGYVFSNYKKLPIEKRISIKPYIKTLVPEIACAVYHLNYNLNIKHFDMRLDNILLTVLKNESEYHESFMIVDFGVSALYRAGRIIFDTDPDSDKLPDDITRTESDKPYVGEHMNTATNCHPDCLSCWDFFTKDAILPDHIRTAPQLPRHIFASAEIYAIIVQFIHMLLDIDVNEIKDDSIRLYNTSGTSYDAIRDLMRNITSRRLYVNNEGMIDIKMEGKKQLTFYEDIYCVDGNEHVELKFVHNIHRLAEQMAGCKIEHLPITVAHNLEQSLTRIHQEMEVFNRPYYPYVKIPEHIAHSLDIKILDGREIPRDQIITKMYTKMTQIPPLTRTELDLLAVTL